MWRVLNDDLWWWLSVFFHRELLQLTVSFVPFLALQSVPKRWEWVFFPARHPRGSDWLDFPDSPARFVMMFVGWRSLKSFNVSPLSVLVWLIFGFAQLCWVMCKGGIHLKLWDMICFCIWLNLIHQPASNRGLTNQLPVDVLLGSSLKCVSMFDPPEVGKITTLSFEMNRGCNHSRSLKLRMNQTKSISRVQTGVNNFNVRFPSSVHLAFYPLISHFKKILSMNGSASTHVPKDEADGFGLVNGTDGYQKVEGNQATGAGGQGCWR